MKKEKHKKICGLNNYNKVLYSNNLNLPFHVALITAFQISKYFGSLEADTGYEFEKYVTSSGFSNFKKFGSKFV